MKLIMLICSFILSTCLCYAHTTNPVIKKPGKKNQPKQSTRILNCETSCCSYYQSNIQYNNALLSFQVDNCGNNSTTASSYESCLDMAFYAYQLSATQIFTAYSLCMYYSGGPY